MALLLKEKLGLLKGKVRNPSGYNYDPILADMERVITGKEQELEPKPEIIEVETLPESKEPIWKRKELAAGKTTVVRCIVIDQMEHWHDHALVDLKGVDVTTYSWGYYGARLPVLVEQKDGSLEPFYLPDHVGESSNRLFKAAHPECFRNSFKHRNNMLQKIKIGLMVALVLGLFGIMFILINF